MRTSPGDEEVPGRLRRLEQRIVDRMAERAVADASRRPEDRTTDLLRYRLLGVLVVLPVHLVTAFFGGGGLLLLVLGATWPLKVLGGVGLLVAFGTRPSLPRRPDHDARLTRPDAPHLFGLLDDVSRVVDTRPPDEVLVRPDVNAFATRVGLRRRSLGLGAPLWVACSPLERTALLGHEIGHFAHGDLTDGLVVGAARQTLLHWYDVAVGLRAGSLQVTLVQQIAFAPLRGLVTAYLLLITLVNAPLRRRREHLADLASVRVAGTDGARDLLDVLVSTTSIEVALSRAVAHPERPDLWQTVREQMATVTPQVRARRRQDAETTRSRIDDSHPATHLRIRLVDAWPRRPAGVDVEAHDWAAIDAELAPALVPAARSTADLVRWGY